MKEGMRTVIKERSCPYQPNALVCKTVVRSGNDKWRINMDCAKCGWNPDVEAKRKKRLNGGA